MSARLQSFLSKCVWRILSYSGRRHHKMISSCWRSEEPSLLADGVGPEQLTEEQRVAMDPTGLTVVRQRMRVLGVPFGTELFQRDFLQEAVNGEPAELVRALVPMENAQTSFRFCVYLPLLASHICFERSRPPSRAKLQQITTLWWSGRWRLS